MAQAVHLPILARRRDLFETVALCDCSPGTLQAAGDLFGIERRHATLEELLAAGGVDAVMLFISGSHGAAAAAVTAAGLPVFCEKPLCYTRVEAEGLVGARLALGYMKVYDPAVERACRLLATRPVPRSVEVTVLHPPSEVQLGHVRLMRANDVPADVSSALAAESEALLDRALGDASTELRRLYTDVLLGSVIHDLAVVRALVGAVPERIDHVDRWPEGVFPPSIAIVGMLAGGTRLSIRWHYLPAYPAYREEVRVHDETGSLALVFPSPYLLNEPTELVVTGAEDDTVRTTRYRSTAEAFERQLEAFYRLVVADEPAAAGPAEGLADVVTCQRVVARLAQLAGLPIGGEAV